MIYILGVVTYHSVLIWTCEIRRAFSTCMTFYTIVPVYVNEKIIFHLEMLTACGASVTMNIVMLHLYVTFYARLAAELVAAFVAHVTATFMYGTNVHLGIFGSTVHLATESARVLACGVW